MTERKKRRQKNELPGNKLSKEDDAIARFIRFNCPTNSTVFEGNQVDYFSGKKAIETLLNSKKYGVASKNPRFSTTQSAEDFLRGLLERGFFFRAKKVVLKKKDKTVNELEKKIDKSPKIQKLKKNVETKTTVNENEANDAADDEENVDVSKGEKKKKKKIRLLFHDVQTFITDYVDSDVYVWVFDPTPFYKKFIGFLMVLGTIAGCLFPLWPDWLRLAIYYLSIAGIALFGVLLGVALIRTIFFGLIWAVTLGRHKLWVLPNLTEDCGFCDSFKPFYSYEYVPNGIFGTNVETENSDNKKKKKKNEKLEKNDEKEDNKECNEKENNTTIFENSDENDERHETANNSNNIEKDNYNEKTEMEHNEDQVRHRKTKAVDDDFVIVEKNGTL